MASQTPEGTIPTATGVNEVVKNREALKPRLTLGHVEMSPEGRDTCV